MMKKITIAIVAVMLLSLFSPLSIVSANYVVADNMVFINDSNVYLSASPHTIYSSGWVYFNLTSKTYTGDIDAVWGFDRSTIKPTKAELYKPHWVNWTTNHSYFFYNVSNIELTDEPCEIGDSDSLYKRKITYQVFAGYNNTTNTTIYNTTSSVVCFDSYTTDGTNYTAYWTEDHSRVENWLDISSTFGKTSLDHGGMNTWFYLKNIPVTAGKNYTIRAWVDVPVTLTGEYGKYWWAVKPSSETIGEAISSGHFYALDPWFNASWGKRRPIQINNTGNANDLDYYQVNINISYDSDMNSDFSDIRIVNDTANATVPYWIESKVDGSWANVWFNCTHIPASSWLNDTYYLYYGNSGATDASDGDATFEFFDDFEGTSLDTSKWDDSSAGSYSIADSAIGMTGDWNDKIIKTAKTDFAMPLIVELKIKASTTDTDIDLVVPFNWVPWASGGDSCRWDVDANEKLEIRIGGDCYIHGSGFPDTNWHRARAIFTSSEFKIWTDWDTEYSDSGSPTNTVGWLGVFADPEAGRTGYVDWYAVRKYTSPEPTAMLGAEESPGPADTSFTVTLPAGYTYAKFEPTLSTDTDVEPNGQNSTIPFYNVTNTGDVSLDIRMRIQPDDFLYIGDASNQSLPVSEVYADDTYFYVGHDDGGYNSGIVDIFYKDNLTLADSIAPSDYSGFKASIYGITGDGSYLYVDNYAYRIHKYDIGTWSEVINYTAVDTLHCLVFDGNFLYTGGCNPDLLKINKTDMTVEAQNATNYEVYGVDEDETYVYYIDAAGVLERRYKANMTVAYTGDISSLSTLAISVDDNYIYLLGDNGVLEIRDKNDYSLVNSIGSVEATNPTNHYGLFVDSNYIYVGHPSSVEVYDVRNVTSDTYLFNLTEPTDFVLSIYAHLNTLYVACKDTKTYVYTLGNTPENIILKADTDNTPTGAQEVNTTLSTIYENLAPDNSVNIWLWSDFYQPPPQTINKTLEINVTQ